MKTYIKPTVNFRHIEYKEIVATSVFVDGSTWTDEQLSKERSSDWSQYDNN